MRKVILLIVLFIFCILTFNQCKKCNSKKLDDLRFTSTDLKIVPYNGTEILCFKDSIGDSIVYCPNGNGRKNTLNFSYAGRYEQKDDCHPDYYYVENDETTFYRPSSYDRIDIKLSFYTTSTRDYIIKNYFEIEVIFKNPQLWYFIGGFQFYDFKLFDIDTTYSKIDAFNDSLSLGHRTFYSVYTLVQNHDIVNAQNLKTVYYTVEKGVIGFKMDTGLLWLLKE